MANNPYINKVMFGDQAVLDLTSDTVQPSDVHEGYSCHDASGAIINGTFDFVDATSGTATSADLPSGKSLWVNGQLVEGEFQVPTFKDGTDEEIAMALQKHYAGEIDLADYWTVGDKRTIHLNAMSADGVSEAHHADDYEFVIIGMNHDDLTTPINGITKAAVTVHMDRIMYTDTTSQTYLSSDRNAAHEFGYINSSGTNVGGWTSCARRTWCNNVFFEALPQVIQSLVKNVDKKTSAGNQSSTINTDSDKVFLLAEIEIFGTTSYSASGEGTKYPYFDTASNIYKKPSEETYNSALWWERSPRVSYAGGFCCVYRRGDADYDNANGTRGLAPAFCM